jgi:hypothetical protein
VSSLAGKICAYLFILGRRDGLNVLVPLSLERLTFVLLRSRFIGCRICLEIICRIRSSVYLSLFMSWLGWRSVAFVLLVGRDYRLAGGGGNDNNCMFVYTTLLSPRGSLFEIMATPFWMSDGAVSWPRGRQHRLG